MSYRANKSGLAAESQKKIDGNYDQEEAKKCLYWIRCICGCEEIPEDLNDIDASAENFHVVLHDGMIVCKLMDTLFPGKINWKNKTFQVPKIEAMKTMRERERIAMFTNLVVEYGVQDTYVFPTESLHEKGALNLAQVCVCFRALGVEAQSKDGYTGPEGYWPRKINRNTREFTEDQLRAGQGVIGLQMGTNKGASQAGMNIGKSRHILD